MSAASASGVREAREGRVLRLAFDRPQARNALQPEMSRAMTQALRRAASDPELGAVVLHGEGGHFCAGGDLRSLAESRRSEPPAHHLERVGHLNEFVRAIRQCPLPVLAAVEGHAAGAGCVLALACDLLVAAEDAQFTMAYVKAGLSPDGGGTWLLVRSLPRQLAAELALTGTPIGARRLAELGVVNRLAAPGQALAEALAWAARIAEGPRRAIGRIKRLLAQAAARDQAEQMELEREAFVEALHGAEAGEGIAAFLAKRKAVFPRD